MQAPPNPANESARLSFDQAFDALGRLESSEEHFDDMKSRCRALASTWLLATFGGMGYVLTQAVRAPLPQELLAFALAAAGSLGIFLLWMLDLLVYHRLLDASFTEALKLEREFAQLPQVRQRMIDSQPGKQTLFYEAWFYVAGVLAPLCFGGAVAVAWCTAWGAGPAAAMALGLVAVIGALMRWMLWMSPNPAAEAATPAALKGLAEKA